jgi:hypothetical protein
MHNCPLGIYKKKNCIDGSFPRTANFIDPHQIKISLSTKQCRNISLSNPHMTHYLTTKKIKHSNSTPFPLWRHFKTFKQFLNYNEDTPNSNWKIQKVQKCDSKFYKLNKNVCFATDDDEVWKFEFWGDVAEYWCWSVLLAP